MRSKSRRGPHIVCLEGLARRFGFCTKWEAFRELEVYVV